MKSALEYEKRRKCHEAEAQLGANTCLTSGVWTLSLGLTDIKLKFKIQNRKTPKNRQRERERKREKEKERDTTQTGKLHTEDADDTSVSGAGLNAGTSPRNC